MSNGYFIEGSYVDENSNSKCLNVPRALKVEEIEGKKKRRKTLFIVQWTSVIHLVYLFLKCMFTSKDFKMPQLPTHTV